MPCDGSARSRLETPPKSSGCYPSSRTSARRAAWDTAACCAGPSQRAITRLTTCSCDAPCRSRSSRVSSLGGVSSSDARGRRPTGTRRGGRIASYRREKTHDARLARGYRDAPGDLQPRCAVRVTPLERAGYLAHASKIGRRVAEAEDVLRRAAEIGQLVVMVSWGKDSVVAADLALRALGRVPLLHIASSYRLPGWERVQTHFEARTDVHVIESRRSLAETIEWLRDVGLPHERTRARQAAVVKAIKKD